MKDYLRFSTTGPQEGDLVFVSGHPGHTNRLLTVAELQSMRDRQLPFTLGILKRKEVLIAAWSQRSEENARRAKGLFFGLQNSRKAYDGRLAGLLDPELFAAKTGAENEFKAKLAGKPDALAAYDKISAATRILDAQAHRESLLEGGAAFSSDSFNIARSLLRAGDELLKPNGERLREYTDSEKTSFELALFSEKPIYTDFEILKLTDALTFLCGELGTDDPLAQKILAGKSPRERAVELINGTKVRDVAFRKQLYKGGAQAVSAANDPMIELARLVDADSRALRKISEDQGEAIEEAHAAIDRARNELLGTTGYPDATFTLRLSIGTVKGYEEDGKTVAPITTIGSLYAKAARAQGQDRRSTSWNCGKKAEPLLDPKTPLNFVSTNDIIGGNSGSPVVNRAAEFVGIIFDGNLQSLSWDEVYSDKQGRSISVDSAAILEALEKVYGMTALAEELRQR